MDATTAVLLELLLKDIKSLLEDDQQIKQLHQQHKTLLVPNVLQLYKFGCLFELILAHTNVSITTAYGVISNYDDDDVVSKSLRDLCTSFYTYVQSIPESDRYDLFEDLVTSIIILVQRQKNNSSSQQQQQQQESESNTDNLLLHDDIYKALTSLVQLYHHTSPLTYYYPKHHWTIERLTILLRWYNDSCSLLLSSSSSTTTRIQTAIYTIIAYCIHLIRSERQLLYESLLQIHADERETRSMTEMKGLENTALILQLLHEYNHWDTFAIFMNEKCNPDWVDQLLQKLPIVTVPVESNDKSNEEQHRQQYYAEYIQSVLSTNTTTAGTVLPKIQHVIPSPQLQTTSTKNKSRTTISNATKIDEIQKRINQVKMILPQYGDGFIEIALTCYNNNVEETISILSLDDGTKTNWARPLQNIATTLPRRHIKQLNNIDEEMEAKQITKAAIQIAEQQAKLEAQMLTVALSSFTETNDVNNEYDDDYDDQYDDVIVSNVNDVQLYDNDNEYKAILTYNRAMKQVESDEQYWENERNTNHRVTKNNHNADDEVQDQSSQQQEQDKKQYRGPDLLRGGRIPGGRYSGRGRGRVSDGRNSHEPATQQNPSLNTSANKNQSETKKPTPSNLRHKARILDKRRDHQKKAQVKRTGP